MEPPIRAQHFIEKSQGSMTPPLFLGVKDGVFLKEEKGIKKKGKERKKMEEITKAWEDFENSLEIIVGECAKEKRSFSLLRTTVIDTIDILIEEENWEF